MLSIGSFFVLGFLRKGGLGTRGYFFGNCGALAFLWNRKNSLEA